MAVDAVERETEYARADQDEHDEGREARRGVHALFHELPVETLACQRHQQRTGGAHGTTFGRCGHAKKDRTQHQKDQRQHGNQYEHHALGQLRQQAELECAVEYRREERNAGTDRRGDDDDFVERRTGWIIEPGKRHCGNGRHNEQDQQRPIARVAVGFQQRARLRRQCRRPLGLEDADAHRVDRVQPGQHDARNECTGVHVTHRLAQLICHDDQHQRWRDDLGECSGGSDHPRREATVIAVAQHDRQRDQPHRNHRSGHNAGGGGQQRTDKDHCVGQAAADRAKQLADGFEQVLGHAAAFEDEPHEREERDRQQRVVGHHAPDPFGQRLEQRGLQETQFDANQSEADAHRAECEGHRVARKHHDDQRREHQRRHVVDQEGSHARSPDEVPTIMGALMLFLRARAGSRRPALPRPSFRSASRKDPGSIP